MRSRVTEHHRIGKPRPESVVVPRHDARDSALLVIVWRDGLMNVAGFSVTLVKESIGAMSVGVDIAYAINVTMRYRQKLTRST